MHNIKRYASGPAQSRSCSPPESIETSLHDVKRQSASWSAYSRSRTPHPYSSELLHHVKRQDSSRSGHSRSKSYHMPQHKSLETSLHDMKRWSTHSLPSNLVSQQYTVPIQINTFVQSDTDQSSFLQEAVATTQESVNVAAQGQMPLLDPVHQKSIVQSDPSSLVRPTQQIVSPSCITSLLRDY